MVGDRVVDKSGDVVGSSGFYIDVTESHGPTKKESVDEIVSEIAISRSVIEQAKGMLMVVYGVPADRAFDIVVWRSQETNTKLKTVAEQLITRVRENFHVSTVLRNRFDQILLQH
ncbi:ANTAR domain-containing protein [Rhodococcus sp. OK302]|uniref:ANTAR domain-containing protein n=1 Tax=Rhodococcus sp. OK302 TaxID=1882769 RepID=UPI0020CDE48F|nr:ANTAR domain-containing protein [Rhodococcus sp. OK302]